MQYYKKQRKKIWRGQINRCNNPLSQAWDSYGGRGIRVYKKWKFSFKLWDKYVTKLPSYPGKKRVGEYVLHRIDNEKGYFPGNIIWMKHSDHVRLHNTKYLPGDKIKEFTLLDRWKSGRYQYGLFYCPYCECGFEEVISTVRRPAYRCKSLDFGHRNLLLLEKLLPKY